jgi:hypothetical protein
MPFALGVQALRWAVLGALGYFSNNIVENVTKTVPVLPRNKDGSTPWWVVVLILAIAAYVVSYAFNMIFGKSKR